MSEFSVGAIVTVESWDVQIEHVLFSDDRVGAYLGATPDENRVLVWVGSAEWAQGTDRLLRSAREHLPRVLARGGDEGQIVLLLEGPPTAAVPFDDAAWRNAPADVAVSALRSLALALGELHSSRGWLHGIKRPELLFDPENGALHVAAMPRLHVNDRPSIEAPWRDMRLIGELAYENFLEDEYPGGHQMAAILQDRTAIADLGIVFPGLPQLLAGCVSPYGDLAYANTDELLSGLAQLELELTRSWSFRVGSASTVGNYIFRKNNQDSCGHIAFQSICGSEKVSLGFFCVADGIGGIQDGERASRLAVQAACESFGRGWANYGAERLIEKPNEFAQAIAKVVGQRLALEGEFEPDNNRGGTTFSGLLIAGDRAAVCHVGDSRIMLVRDGKLTLLTHDHTLANILIALGELTESEAEDHELSQRTISRFLSTATEVELDRIDTFGPAARRAFDEALLTEGLRVRPGDLFILTSDGAHGEITVDELSALLKLHGKNPQALCDEIVQNALRKIGRDNSTVLAVLIED